MENLDQIFILIAQKEGISLNLDILETGLINIIALLIILIVAIVQNLPSFLKERKTTIIKSIEDAENRLKEAQNRLEEANKQLNQATILIAKIRAETVITKKLILEAESFDAQKDLKLRFERALSSFKTTERQLFFEIKNQITTLVLNRTVIRVKETFEQDKPAADLINNTIRTLELS